MAEKIEVTVEALTDESGTDYCVRLDLGREVMRSRWTNRRDSAEKLARTLRDAFGVAPSDGSKQP